MIAVAAFAFLLAAVAAQPSSVTVVDVRSTDAFEVVMAVLAGAGLDNRDAATTFVLTDDYDPMWIATLLPNTTQHAVSPLSYLQAAFAKHGAVVYESGALNNSLLPSVVTLCGLLDALPMDAGLRALFPSTAVVADTTAVRLLCAARARAGVCGARAAWIPRSVPLCSHVCTVAVRWGGRRPRTLSSTRRSPAC
jgi:hypothetical protein